MVSQSYIVLDLDRSNTVSPFRIPAMLVKIYIYMDHAARQSSLTHEDFMDHSAPSLDPLPIDDAGMGSGENLDGEVYGLSNLRQF